MTSLTHAALDYAAAELGTTVEGLATSHAALVQQVIPNSVLAIVEAVAHNLQTKPAS